MVRRARLITPSRDELLSSTLEATSPLRWVLIGRFLFNLGLGFALAIGCAVLLSQGSPPSAPPEDLQLFGAGFQKLQSRYFILTVAGAMGGILCSFLLEEDKILEFPSWWKDGRGLQLGFLQDMLVGIAGAMIAYLVLPADFLDGNEANDQVALFVSAIVGGYGGEYLMKAALKRLVNRVDEVEITDEQIASAEQIHSLQQLASQQIEHGLSPAQLARFQAELVLSSRNASPLEQEAVNQVFLSATDARRLGSRVDAYSDQINRTIPIFDALVEAQPGHHSYLAQLAAACRDAIPPRLEEAISHFDRAIELRDQSSARENNWRYEFDRVVALIRLSASASAESARSEAQALTKRIEADLRTIQNHYGLARVHQEFDPGRMDCIQDWLQKHPAVAAKLLPQLSRAEPPGSSAAGSSPPAATASTTAVLGQPLRELIPTGIPSRGMELPGPPKVREGPVPDRWDLALEKARLITTGASAITARQDGLSIGGIKASESMAEADWPRIQPLVDRFYAAAAEQDVPPALLAAIASRESRSGAALLADGTGDRGKAFGIMQVDRDSHRQVGAGGDPASLEHIRQATQIYASSRAEVMRRHPRWSDEYVLKGAAVAYNSGSDNVQTLAGMDRGTTGDDYGSDVLARAGFYLRHMKSLAQCKADRPIAGLAPDSGQEAPIATLAPPLGPTPPMPVSSPRLSLQRMTALRNTFLKKRAVQSVQLLDHEKREVPAGQAFDVLTYKDCRDGHFQVTLAQDGSEWFIYDAGSDGHWNTTWEGQEIDAAAAQAPTPARGEILSTAGEIDWSKNDVRISKYFTVGEVTKGDHRRQPKSNSEEEKHILALARELDKIREDWNGPLIVTSWFRPSVKLGYAYDVNRECNGASDSQHIYGRAADVCPVNPSDISNFQNWLDRNWYGHLGLGAQRGFVHLDMRNGKGWKASGPKGGRFDY